MSKDPYQEYMHYSQKNISGQVKGNNLTTININIRNKKTFKKKGCTSKTFNLKIMNEKLIKYLYYLVELYLTCYNIYVKCEQSIILKTNVTGYVQIISSYYNSDNFPDQVIINEKNYTPQTRYYLNDSESTIKLIWSGEINNIADLFRECSNITEIDLSNFDTSKVI